MLSLELVVCVRILHSSVTVSFPLVKKKLKILIYSEMPQSTAQYNIYTRLCTNRCVLFLQVVELTSIGKPKRSCFQFSVTSQTYWFCQSY